MYSFSQGLAPHSSGAVMLLSCSRLPLVNGESSGDGEELSGSVKQRYDGDAILAHPSSV